MARGLFISETFVKENSEIDENVDMKLINPTIWYCQKEYIEKTLGTTLYNDLISDVVAGSLSGDNLTLVDDYIADALLFWVKHELQVPLTYKFRNKSVNKNTDPNSQPVGFEEHKYLRDYYKPKAQYFTERLEKYLCANTDLFPLYNTSTEDDDLLPRDTKPQVAVYLGKTEPKRDRYGYYIQD
jgi:hypothetical protein